MNRNFEIENHHFNNIYITNRFFNQEKRSISRKLLTYCKLQGYFVDNVDSLCYNAYSKLLMEHFVSTFFERKIILESLLINESDGFSVAGRARPALKTADYIVGESKYRQPANLRRVAWYNKSIPENPRCLFHTQMLGGSGLRFSEYRADGFALKIQICKTFF